MNIGFDAKRAFHNNTGLGVYSRVLLNLLAEQFPEHHYYLFNPKPGKLYKPDAANVHEILPQEFLHKLFISAWRSNWVTGDLKKYKIDLFHGLSHEVPLEIDKTGIPSIVTMHDLFPELYPDNFKKIDLRIYRAKTRYACTHATRILAISKETKKQIVKVYDIDPEKIDVIYQSYDPVFDRREDEDRKRMVREKYGLPEQFFLHVGTIIERKNLLNIVKAINEIKNEIDVPLVVIGKGVHYKEQIKAYIKENGLENRVVFLSDEIARKNTGSFIETQDMPAIYQSALAMIYPSFYEGFGIPVAEALASGAPVITSNTSCLPEAGGDAAFYVDPSSYIEMADGLRKIYSDVEYVQLVKQKGFEQVKKFSQKEYVSKVMQMYHRVYGAQS